MMLVFFLNFAVAVRQKNERKQFGNRFSRNSIKKPLPALFWSWLCGARLEKELIYYKPARQWLRQRLCKEQDII